MHFIDNNNIPSGSEVNETHRRSEALENHKFLAIFHDIDISTPNNNKQFSLSATNERRMRKESKKKTSASTNFPQTKVQ